jgi:hypothetical protein
VKNRHTQIRVPNGRVRIATINSYINGLISNECYALGENRMAVESLQDIEPSNFVESGFVELLNFPTESLSHCDGLSLHAKVPDDADGKPQFIRCICQAQWYLLASGEDGD